jgi:hypothetical protein
LQQVFWLIYAFPCLLYQKHLCQASCQHDSNLVMFEAQLFYFEIVK